jgi:Fe-S-cluster-containing hydrogenase component 2
MERKRFIEKVLLREREPGQVKKTRLSAELIASLSKLSPLSSVHPWFKANRTDMRWLPINEDIELPPGAPAPLELLERFIEESSHRVIFEACGCRTAYQCEQHPRDIGCLLMGDSTLESPPSVSREVGPAEAKEHMLRAVEAGLVPMVGKARVDNFIFGIKDRRRMLTTCFCCDCCCMSRYERFFPVDKLDELFPRIDGIHLEVTDACDGCGDSPEACAERCYIKAIDVVDGMPTITDRCRACGRCAIACPVHAIHIRIDEDRFLEKSYERIVSQVRHY